MVIFSALIVHLRPADPEMSREGSETGPEMSWYRSDLVNPDVSGTRHGRGGFSRGFSGRCGRFISGFVKSVVSPHNTRFTSPFVDLDCTAALLLRFLMTSLTYYARLIELTVCM